MNANFLFGFRQLCVGMFFGAAFLAASTQSAFAADTTKPVVGEVSPLVGTQGVVETFSVSYSDDVGVVECTLYMDGPSQGVMTLSGGKGSTSGTASLAVAPPDNGANSAYVICTDAENNAGTGTTVYVVAADPDTTAPTVSAITPTTGTVGAEVTMTVTYSDAVGVTACSLHTGSDVFAMTLDGAKATYTDTLDAAGSFSAWVTCVDAAGNTGTGSSVTFVASADTTAPTVSSITPTTATAGTAATFTVTYSDNVGVSSCTLYIGGVNQGAMTLDGAKATKSYTFSASGTFNAKATCLDAAGNSKSGTVTSIVVAAASSSSDTTAPVVGSITPTTGVVGVETTVSTTYSDAVGVTACSLHVGSDVLAMTLSSGKASYTDTFDAAGSFSVLVTCVDAAGNTGTGSTVTLTVTEASSSDTTAPTVSSITPTTAIVGVSTTFGATYSDAVGVVSCTGYDNGSPASATLSSGKATISGAMSTEGVHSMYMTCVDAAGNIGTGPTTSVTVAAASSADTAAPAVGSVTPTTTTAGVSTVFSTTYSDNVGVVSCTGYLNGNAKSMALASGVASASGTLDTSGDYSIYVTCVDAAGNVGTGSTVTVKVGAASTDTTGPTVGGVTPTTATQNAAVTFSATVTDESGVYECRLMVNGNDQGTMTASSSTYSRSYTPASSGTLTAYVWCGDMVGNVGMGTSVTVTVAAAATTATDTVAPTVGAITPTEAVAGSATTLSASVEDSGGMGTCTLYVNSTNIGPMSNSGGYATYLYTFTAEGDAIANAYCVDAAGNATRGASTTITIAAAVSSEQKIAVSEADVNSIIKLACGSDADAEDPCHAVYYYDGKRHAFPNEKVFFSWYDSFDDVVVVTEDFLSSITLGFNVTYHPGTTMVKFITQNTVYAVGEAGELRAIASEDVAVSIWGSDWNTQIDDISDAFYGNYHFGDDINSTSDFDPDAVESSVTNIIDILQA